MEKKRILVVDDETEFLETFLDFLSFQFDSSKLIVDSALNGLEALDRLRVNNYDLVITDMRMPKMDGMELIKQIRQSKDFDAAQLKIIVFSGHAGEEEKGDMKQYGVETLVKKPHLPELMDQLKNSLNLTDL